MAIVIPTQYLAVSGVKVGKKRLRGEGGRVVFVHGSWELKLNKIRVHGESQI